MSVMRVFTGQIKEYEKGFRSAIAKEETTATLMLTENGLTGDDQEMKRNHGGPDRALLQFSPSHYEWYKMRIPERSERFMPAAFGENLSIAGFDENNVHIGDIFSWGDTLIQVSQPRSPCYRLDIHLDWKGLALLMQQHARCGWLYRVLKTGPVSHSAPFTLQKRGSGISIREAMFILFGDETAPPLTDPGEWRRLLMAEGLSDSWRQTLTRRIETGEIEPWEKRLLGPDA
ncbi:MOSC domain-containing protein [Oxalobacter sp. OttesenSCG-928-P03]|nr:MOSC domain-containing protein [Oxalobacter sp. OttesenSCG-928-P03]